VIATRSEETFSGRVFAASPALGPAKQIEG